MDSNLDFTDGNSGDLFIKLIASQHNNTHSQRIGMSPNKCDLRYAASLAIDINTRITGVHQSNEEAQFYNSYIKKIKRVSTEIANLRLEKYDRKRKECYDKHKTDSDHEVEELVLYYKGSETGFGKNDELKIK